MKVRFDLENIKIDYTYENYDRSPIDSVIYLKNYNRIGSLEWDTIIDELNEYKVREMILHENNVPSLVK